MDAEYIETSVVSYYVARASRDVVVAGHQQATVEFWRRLGADFEPYVSALVIQEAGKGDAELAQKRLDAVSAFPIIETTPEAEEIAGKIHSRQRYSRSIPGRCLAHCRRGLGRHRVSRHMEL
ncbi:type II toxin-antitoxin system VapC family toxin [Pontiella desulfatans]|uniref:type II toxin-antitoxin system VapC family toxin n=1 Tax=Pontiella desulfatans TaxID=2750659 RepID=UPI00109D52DB|nr:type II toxin-antitoxin system VapC family toxin [Pontiella desulfatans]